MLLEAKNISFRYGKNLPWLFENRSLSVKSGEVVALFAPSGYGKTTLAKILAGYLQPMQGEVLIDGKPLPKKGFCPVQLIYQHPEKAINPRWKLKKVLEESGELNMDMLRAFGIEEAWLDRFPRELSGGELQRFCVARALLSGADFLICDEISTMLDVITQAQIWNVVLDEAKKRGMGIIAVTHNRHLAERICDRIVDLSKIDEGVTDMHNHHDHDHVHPHDHSHGHDHGHTHDNHEHEHTHYHVHGHEHGEHGHGHTHDHDDHHHQHAHGHTHSHPHDHTHGDEHCHTHDDLHAVCDEGHASAELLALMRYMTGHNVSHAKELADLAVKLRDTVGENAYNGVMAAVADYERGNEKLAAVLAVLDK